jgi:hypothetical protein
MFPNFLKAIPACALMASCLLAFAQPCYGNKQITYAYNLGGMPISCSIYVSQACVSGISTSMTRGKVYSILGSPDYSNSSGGSWTYTYGKYGNGITLKFIDYGGSGNPTVCDIEVTSPSYATIDGVVVGMPASVLSSVYGTADVVNEIKMLAPKLTVAQQQKYTDKFAQTVYTYYASEVLTMSFKVKGNIIRSINVHLTD